MRWGDLNQWTQPIAEPIPVIQVLFIKLPTYKFTSDLSKKVIFEVCLKLYIFYNTK
jgi:hypothetical protein